MTVKIDGSNGLLANYDFQTPTTGFSYTFTTYNVLFAVPAGTLATGTVTMSATPVDGTMLTITSTQQITALTINANTGQSIIGGGAVQLNANTSRQYMYRAANTTWYLTNIAAGNVVTSVNGATGAVTGVGTVTSITAGGGLTGGTITSTGTIAVDTTFAAIGTYALLFNWTRSSYVSGSTSIPAANLGYITGGNGGNQGFRLDQPTARPGNVTTPGAAPSGYSNTSAVSGTWRLIGSAVASSYDGCGSGYTFAYQTLYVRVS